MAVEIVPFAAEHIEDAAALIAGSYRQHRKLEPSLAATWESRPERAQTLKGALAQGPGVLGRLDGRIVAFLICRIEVGSQTRLPVAGVPSSPPPGGGPAFTLGTGRRAAMLAQFHARDSQVAAEIYAEMYASLAPRLITNGCFDHDVTIPAADDAAVQVWFALGFGREMVWGVRPLEPLPSRSREFLIRRATPGDLGALSDLYLQLARFHSRPPAFSALLLDYPGLMHELLRLLEDDSSPVWLVLDGARPLAMLAAQPGQRSFLAARTDSGMFISDAFTLESARFGGAGSALLGESFAWAREQGYDVCTVGWSSQNLVASRFWPARGFRPTFYRLQRRIDPSIAWANDRIPDDDLWRRWC